MGKDKILDRWAEYIRELFEDHRKDQNVMKCSFYGPLITKDEIQVAIRKMKSGRATWPDSISVEFLKALGDYRIDKRYTCASWTTPRYLTECKMMR